MAALLPALVLLFLVSGACGLIYQVLWLRLLGLVFGVTVYAASTVWASFMGGLALGSFAGGRLGDRVKRPLVWFGAAEALVGLSALATPAALETIRILKDGLLRNAEVVGDYLFGRLTALMDKHALIGDVRGKGLMIGVELVKDRKTKVRGTAERNQVVQEMFQRGVLILGAGRNAIRFAPPLVLSKDQADTIVEIFDESLAAVGRG